MEGAHFDVLQCIVAQVYRHGIAKMLETIAVKPSQGVSLQVELKGAEPRLEHLCD